ncbi:MAG: HD domain-containing protein [Acidaminococcales bacterium]|jgi:exopolyphosphatase/guanosine-5'-triphosphate,3'-diphosphate pyrophosphatase|nr:HD domain-containing protein [Acidaminococcales bacterium]
MSKKAADIFAAIHLGSEKVSLKIVEYRSLEYIKVLDFAEQRVRIGEETFKTGMVSLVLVRELCEILNNYKRLMKEYGVENYFLIGTTAMREARNRVFMIDQILMATGLKVEVIDMPLEIYYKYISIARTLKKAGIGADGSATLFADISSGGLGITMVENGEIKYQQNIHIGVIRVKESFDKKQRSTAAFNTSLTEYLNSIVSPVHDNLQNFNIQRIVLSGTNTSLLLNMLGKKDLKDKVAILPTSLFEALYQRVIDMKLAKIMHEFALSEQVAEIVLPTIIFYQQLIALTSVQEIVVPPDSFIDAMVVLYIAREKNHEWLRELDAEIVNFVGNIAKHYNYQSAHAKQVARLSEQIFARMRKPYRFSDRHRLILQIASILHDIGKFVNLRQHYFYSYRLILSTDIFGLSDEEKQLVAYIVYYHAKDLFSKPMEGMAGPKRDLMPIVAKLSAILRIADALDRSYRQKAAQCKISLKGDEMQIIVKAGQDMSLERWTIEDKSAAFEEVFGLKPVLLEMDG